MRLFFKLYNAIFIILIIVNGCQILPPYQSNDIVISDHEKVLIRKFAVENGYPENMAIDCFVRYVYKEWPNESVRKDFFLTFPKQDTIPRTLVLSDVLTSLGKSLRVHYEPAPYGGSIYSAYIDSIELRTDSVIILPGISLSDCNLTHLPKEIGKLRIKSLDIGYNYKTLKSLPDELMQLSEPPFYWDSLTINYDMGAVKSMENVSDSLKNWLVKHAAQK